MATRYRDLQGPTLLRTGIADNSAAQTAAQLASAFKQFESTALDIGGGLRAQEGQRVGTQEGAAGTPRPRTGMAAMTRFGQAYNSAAEVTYANKVKLDMAQQLDRIELESEADPAAYQAKVKGLVDGALREAPAEWRAQLEQMVAPEVAAGASRIARQADAKGKKEALAGFLESEGPAIASLLKTSRDLPREEGDLLMADLVASRRAQLATLVADNVIGPDDAVLLQERFTANLDKQLFDSRTGDVVSDISAAMRADAEDADDLLAALESDEGYTEEEKTAIRSDVRQQFELLQYERSRQYVGDLTNLSRRLAAGEFGGGVESEAKRLYKRAAMSPEEYEGVMTASERNRQAKIERDSASTALATLSGPLHPGNSDDVKLVEEGFQNALKLTGAKPGDENYRRIALQMVQQHNVLPKSARQWAGVAAMSQDPEQAIAAADFMSRVQQENPVAYEWNADPKLDAFFQVLNANTRANMPPEQAYTTAFNATYGMKPAEREIREREYSEYVKKHKSELDVGRQWDLGKNAPIAARAEYESLHHQGFIATGNPEAAREFALGKMAVWGETTVNGEPEIVKYPPEKYGLSSEAVRLDLAASLVPLEVDINNARLIPGPHTDRTKGVYWNVGTLDEFGMPDIVRGADNRPLPYRLPLASDEYAAAQQREKDRLMAEAEAERAQRKQNEADQRELERRIGGLRTAPGLR